MNKGIGQLAAIWVVLVCVGGIGLGRVTFAQDISQLEQAPGWGISDRSYYRSRLLERFELVADGEFFAFPKSAAEELRALKEENVTIKFRIHTLYKGSPQDSIDMRMRIGMLVYPGTDISRHARKKEIIAKQREDLAPLWLQFRAIRSAYKAGEIEESEHWAELSKVSELIEERKAQDGLIGPASEYVVIDSTTFFSLGGVIREGEKYLVGVNRTEPGSNAYLLTEYGTSDIYWGELREHILPGF